MKSKIKVLSLITLIASVHALAIFEGGRKVRSTIPEAIEGQFVVKFKSSNKASLNALASQSGLSVKEVVNEQQKLVLVDVKQDKRFSTKASVKAYRQNVIDFLKQNPNVEYAEPNFIYRAQVLPKSNKDEARNVPNDDGFTKLWGMNNDGSNDSDGTPGVKGADIHAPAAWAIHTGSSKTVVAVIDTGVDYTHPDLKDNAWSDPSNPKVHGFNAITGALDPMDDHNHGSHCSGTIGGVGGNGLGVAGVNWKVSIMGVKFLSAQGSGSLADAVKAIDWAAAHGAKIMSNSWGGGGYSEALKEAISRTNDQGILFIAAAGNDSSDNDKNPAYPASYDLPNVIAVAASTNQDGIASFSNWGRKTVHLLAPGHNIYSTVAKGKYDTYSGTSMATPHVSGAAALIWSYQPELTAAQVKDKLLKSTDKIMALKNKTITRGGRLNIYNLLKGIEPPGPAEVPDSAWGNAQKVNFVTEHPYKDNATATQRVSIPGSTFIRLHFTKFELESGYDFLYIKDANGKVIDQLSGNMPANFWTDTIQGDSVTLEFKADNMVNKWGFELDSAQGTDWHQ